MKHKIHPVLLTMLLVITLVFVFSMAHGQSVVLHGRQFSVVGSSQARESYDSITTYTYRDTNDSVYVVHLSKNLKAFIYRYSERSGKRYKKYLPKVTEQLDAMRQ